MRSDRRWLLVLATAAAPLVAAALTRLALPWSYSAGLVPLGYVVLLLAGVMFPSLALFAPVIRRGNPTRGEVALTFDDGPDPGATPKVLRVLADADVRATFFLLGDKTRAAPEVVRVIAAAGHDIGVHGDTHDRWLALRPPRVIAAALDRARAAVEAVTGARPVWFRPPIGHVSPRTAAAARWLGLSLVVWSVRARDGRASTTAEQAVHGVRAGLRPGAIVLMHDAAEHGDREPVAPAVLPALLDEIARRGLRCVTLSQLLRP